MVDAVVEGVVIDRGGRGGAVVEAVVEAVVTAVIAAVCGGSTRVDLRLPDRREQAASECADGRATG